MYHNGSSSYVGLTIVCPGIDAGIGAVSVGIVWEAGVKHCDIGGGIAKTSRISDCIGVASEMAKLTGIVEDHAEIAESSWMPSEMIEAIEIDKVVEMNDAIVTPGACWVVGAIGSDEASGMLVIMSISSIKNN
jgi:hypothetical protein